MEQPAGDRKPILILGLGNDILTDDGIGPVLVESLQNNIISNVVDFQIITLGGLDVVEVLRHYQYAIVIDAIKTGHAVPGTIFHLRPEDFSETTHLSNIHDISFLTALQLAKELHIPLPKAIDIIAIEIVEDRLFGTEFTSAIQAGYPDIEWAVTVHVKELLSVWQEETLSNHLV